MRPVITLTTDFGTAGPYVGAVKGVILSFCPDVQLVDITHDIPPQNIRVGALVLADASPFFPPGTIHLAVVDPGVGTDRALLYAEIGSQRYLAPDNGLLTLVYKSGPVHRVLRLEERDLWRREVSSTFHARDILAPVAARLAAGLDPARLGPPVGSICLLDWPQPRRHGREIEGQVVAIDSFGNLITNINREHLADLGCGTYWEVCIAGHIIRGLGRTYGEYPAGQLIALIGSANRLEIAVVCGSAATTLQASVDTPVRIRLCDIPDGLEEIDHNPKVRGET